MIVCGKCRKTMESVAFYDYPTFGQISNGKWRYDRSIVLWCGVFRVAYCKDCA